MIKGLLKNFDSAFKTQLGKSKRRAPTDMNVRGCTKEASLDAVREAFQTRHETAQTRHKTTIIEWISTIHRYTWNHICPVHETRSTWNSGGILSGKGRIADPRGSISDTADSMSMRSCHVVSSKRG